MVFGLIAGFIGACVSAVSSIGGALSSFAATIAPTLTNLLMNNDPMTEMLGKLATTLMEALGIIDKEEKVEDIGERALQAKDEGITPEKFENFDEYMQKLREFEIDPEKSANRNPAEKLIAGLGVTTACTEEKLGLESGSMSSMWVLPIANPEYFTAERMENIVLNGGPNGNSLAYLNDELSGAKSRSFEKSLETGSSDVDALYNALDKASTAWTEIAKDPQ